MGLVTMNRRTKDLTGLRFGRLLVKSFSHYNQEHASCWNCVCDCGTKCTIRGYSLLRGKTQSCGCLNKEKQKDFRGHYTHEMSKHPLYKVWKGMKKRCCNKNDKRYHRYGGRGIKICKEWEKPENFIAWGLQNGYKKGLSIDRIDNDGNYEPSNCRFITITENRRNSSLAKITEEDAAEIRKIYAKGRIRQVDIADIYGITQQVVSKIINFKLWV